MHSLSLESVPVTPVMAKTISKGDDGQLESVLCKPFFPKEPGDDAESQPQLWLENGLILNAVSAPHPPLEWSPILGTVRLGSCH